MDNPEPWLTYNFNGFRFEFTIGALIVTDLSFRRKYKIVFTGNREMPFSFILLKC